jgi:hypothetical protein
MPCHASVPKFKTQKRKKHEHLLLFMVDMALVKA